MKTNLLPSPCPRARKPAVVARPSAHPIVRLFVAGASARSGQAILRVRRLCAAEREGSCTLEVIDLYQQPRLAREHQIVAAPTLVIELPRPVRRFIGNHARFTGLFVQLDAMPGATITH